MKDIRTNTLVTCNRCRHEDIWGEETPEYLRWEWSELVIGYDDEHHRSRVFDLCPACTREVKAWIGNGR